MTPREDLRLRIANAEERLGAALDKWDAADLSRGPECCALLTSAIEELAAAQGIAEKHHIPRSTDLTNQVNAIRSDVARMMRLLDASTAFCRGMAASIGAGDGTGTEPRPQLTSVNTQG